MAASRWEQFRIVLEHHQRHLVQSGLDDRRPDTTLVVRAAAHTEICQKALPNSRVVCQKGPGVCMPPVPFCGSAASDLADLLACSASR